MGTENCLPASAMNREKPTSNRICNEKWQERSYRLHRAQLYKVKTTIDTKPPHTYAHLYQRLKKAQLEDERCSIIERDNRTLVKRMSEVMTRNSSSQNDVNYRSLNRGLRKRELLRITEENKALLQRIHARQPTYDRLVWEQQRERNEQLCERICRYPYRRTNRPAAATSMASAAGDYLEETSPAPPAPAEEQEALDLLPPPDNAAAEEADASQSMQPPEGEEAAPAGSDDGKAEDEGSVKSDAPKSDRSGKSDKSGGGSSTKSHKSDKSNKSEKSNKSGGSAKSSKSAKSAKSQEEEESKNDDE
eukprot:NODE_516_length_1584_cov_237.054723_g393_i0.p1 GENE.NODE_516_length_1584_cov_237.054723_g393_i0~~NODE_516_length_1584_cov_237.054723_g393_i0.p1  ORF type:complete len:305 (-),score=51.88 NODE_516_length_1584_cov_237.054723_g393_i0:638-1552(-)